MQSIDPHRTRKNIGCIVGFLVFCVAAMAAGLFIKSTLPPVAAMNIASRFEACDMAQEFVKDNLKAPSTATFASCTDSETTISHSADHWTVMSYVDAQNGFGAQLRNDYLVEMQYHPESDKWTLTNISITGR